MNPISNRVRRPARSPGTLVVLALAALVAVLVPTVAAAQSSEERQLQEAKDRLSRISDDISEAEQDADSAEAGLENADERLREVEAVVNEVAAAVERQEGAVREAEGRLAQVEAEAEEVAEAFAERASRMYKQGANMSFEVMLSSDGAEDAFARTSYLQQVTQADRASIESLDASQVAVGAEQERLEVERERLAELLAEQEELMAEAQAIRDHRAMAAAEAREQVRLLQEEADDLEAEQEELQALIQRRQEEERRAARVAPSAAPTGTASSSGFAWPLCAPVTSEYGPRWGRMHRGIDQGASTGTPVGASKSGTVIFAGRQGGYGNLVLVDHHDGVVTAYAHLSGFSVSQGGSVSQGQTVGAVGSTGNSTGPHLHFETRANGNAVNPRQYLPGSPC